jgi:hypothetical protein
MPDVKLQCLCMPGILSTLSDIAVCTPTVHVYGRLWVHCKTCSYVFNACAYWPAGHSHEDEWSRLLLACPRHHDGPRAEDIGCLGYLPVYAADVHTSLALPI